MHFYVPFTTRVVRASFEPFRTHFDVLELLRFRNLIVSKLLTTYIHIYYIYLASTFSLGKTCNETFEV